MKKNCYLCTLARGISMILLAVMLCASIASCSDGGSGGDATGYSVTVAGKELTADMLMSDVKEALGSTYEVRESQACPPFSGTERLYDFSSLQVTTYEEDGKERVMVIFLKDESANASGVTIGSTVDEMKTALGEEYSMLGTGTYVYTAKDGSVLKCGVMNDAVRSITLTTEKADD